MHLVALLEMAPKRRPASALDNLTLLQLAKASVRKGGRKRKTAASSGKPWYPCGRKQLSQLSLGMRERWATDQGEKWHWKTPQQAYFRLSGKMLNAYQISKQAYWYQGVALFIWEVA